MVERLSEGHDHRMENENWKMKNAKCLRPVHFAFFIFHFSFSIERVTQTDSFVEVSARPG
jgi:hypothetical protein